MSKRKKIVTEFEKKAKTLRARLITGTWLAVVLVILFFLGRFVVTDATAQETRLSGAEQNGLEVVSVPDDVTNETVAYKGFTVYFNKKYHVPNCVIYELTGTEVDGDNPRFKNFVTDEGVEGCANPWDYTNSGYDRGHMAPAGDMKWSADAMRESFFMTNVCPQVKSLNSGAWNKLEIKVRDWAVRDSALIVATGPILTDGMATIGKTGVAVPCSFYKVILAPYASPMRAIAFIYANEKNSGGLKEHAVSVDEVERLTGLDFFSSLPDDIENDVEKRVNVEQWNVRY